MKQERSGRERKEWKKEDDNEEEDDEIRRKKKKRTRMKESDGRDAVKGCECVDGPEVMFNECEEQRMQ